MSYEILRLYPVVSYLRTLRTQSICAQPEDRSYPVSLVIFLNGRLVPSWDHSHPVNFAVLYPWATNVWYSDMATRTQSVWPFFTHTNKVCYQTRARLLTRATLVGNLTDKLMALILVPYLLDSLLTFRIQRWTFCSRSRG